MVASGEEHLGGQRDGEGDHRGVADDSQYAAAPLHERSTKSARGHESAAFPGATTAAGWSVAGARGALEVPPPPPRVRGSSGRMSTVAPTISAFGPLYGRQASPPGRQRTTRHQIGLSAAP